MSLLYDILFVDKSCKFSYRGNLMDKVTRILLLYSKLIRGECVNKINFCLETEISERTFDRDIEDVRIFLGESFGLEELLYDRKYNQYSINVNCVPLFDKMEIYFLIHLLQDAKILRKDELIELTKRLCEYSEIQPEGQKIINKKTEEYKEPFHKIPLLKIFHDLVEAIDRKILIQINYINANGVETRNMVIPCQVKYKWNYLYLIAYVQTKKDIYPTYFRVDRIQGFERIRELRYRELDKINNYNKHFSNGIVGMFGGDYIKVVMRCDKHYISYIMDELNNAKIVAVNDESMLVEAEVFDKGFVKWVLRQPVCYIEVLEPDSVRIKIMQSANEIKKTYGGKENG